MNNNIQPKIEDLSKKKLVGLNSKMSFDYAKIIQLWKRFMPRKKEILNVSTTEVIAMQVYENANFNIDKQHTEFVMWAVTEVTDFNGIPKGMESFTLSNGLYAVFLLKGTDAESLFQYIFKVWLPNSDYSLDDRPHFQVMGHNYKNNDPNSEENMYVPIKKKNNDK